MAKHRWLPAIALESHRGNAFDTRPTTDIVERSGAGDRNRGACDFRHGRHDCAEHHRVGRAPKWTSPRTEWGDPDLQGMLELRHDERRWGVPRGSWRQNGPSARGEAAAYEKQTVDRQAVTNNTAGPDWWDPGTRHLVDRRTSLVVDPSNGECRRAARKAEAAGRRKGTPRPRRIRGRSREPSD